MVGRPDRFVESAVVVRSVTPSTACMFLASHSRDFFRMKIRHDVVSAADREDDNASLVINGQQQPPPLPPSRKRKANVKRQESMGSWSSISPREHFQNRFRSSQATRPSTCQRPSCLKPAKRRSRRSRHQKSRFVSFSKRKLIPVG